MNPLDYFEEILAIPRSSGHEQKISEYMCNFALKNNLEYSVDDVHNVIIKRKSNNESNDTVILQGHLDMVCASVNDYDFMNKGIDWYIENGYYKAYGTTLGADNGIGCSIILALLANKNIKVPNIEAVFTVQEETTMNGAKKLDYQKLQATKMISIDGTEEGIIDVSSASMVSIDLSKKITFTPYQGKFYKIVIGGLHGGHSGTDIDKGYGNAIKIMGDILSSLDDVQIVTLHGGSRDNVIPSDCMCIIKTDQKINVDNSLYKMYPEIVIHIEELNMATKVMNIKDSKYIIDVIHNLPINVLSYHGTFPQTSLNLGVIFMTNEVMHINLSIRSIDQQEEEKYITIVKNLAHEMSFLIKSRAPSFKSKEKSHLRDLLVEKYYNLYHKKIVLEDVHAGLEGGIFAENIKDLDVCVIAPNLYDIHSVNERVEINSVIRVYNWLIAVLAEL